jgi:hypothetical protein
MVMFVDSKFQGWWKFGENFPKITKKKENLNLMLKYSWPFWWYIDDIYHDSMIGDSVVAPRVSHTPKACYVDDQVEVCCFVCVCIIGLDYTHTYITHNTLDAQEFFLEESRRMIK